MFQKVGIFFKSYGSSSFDYVILFFCSFNFALPWINKLKAYKLLGHYISDYKMGCH